MGFTDENWRVYHDICSRPRHEDLTTANDISITHGCSNFCMILMALLYSSVGQEE